ncbi:hypothetical protein EB118_05995 [bacterium]|nr:hypothetical protein [bacterium]NBX97701.1 hypothetical protein [bacterium]NDC94226.1 hypothetical protein [bacterium]NDD84922.1 hypothetical protein [bacterium]NDG29630.1 hypothetical protein [bacterium]
MSKRQFSKQPRPPHKRSDRLKPGRLAQTLRKDWKQEHGPSTGTALVTREHIDRARTFDLPADVDDDSLVARAMTSYFNTRAEMSEERVVELGARSASAATDQVVFEHFIPDQTAASAEELMDVSRGISLAKIALNRTTYSSQRA